jgi:Tol biopolymer transport system component
MTDFDTKPKREKPKRSPHRRAMLTFAAGLIALVIIIIGSLLIRGTIRPFIPSIATPTLSSMYIPAAGQIAFIEAYTYHFTIMPGAETYQTKNVITVMNTDGSNKIRLPTESTLKETERNLEGKYLLGWSPDNKQLLFIKENDLYVINSDGSGETKLISNTPPALISAVWSQDGKSILFTRTPREESVSAFLLFTINVDGSAEAVLKNINLKNPVFVTGAPRLSPDGERIAFVSRNDVARSLHVVSANGSDPIKLVERFEISDLSWSPDGKHIAFSSVDDQTSEILERSKGVFRGTTPPIIRHIYVVDIDNRSLRQVTRNWNNHFPAWSPDGQRIAFTSQRDNKSPSGQPAEIYSVKVDGSEEIRLTDSGNYMYIIW